MAGLHRLGRVARMERIVIPDRLTLDYAALHPDYAHKERSNSFKLLTFV